MADYEKKRFECTVSLTWDTLIRADDLKDLIRGKYGDTVQELMDWTEEVRKQEPEFKSSRIVDSQSHLIYSFDIHTNRWTSRS